MMLGASSLLTACANQSETNTTIETKQVVADPEYEVKSPYTLLTNGNGLYYEEVDPSDRRSTDELPAQYTQIEYIQSTGKQKIDTGYIPNEQTQIEAKFFVPFISSSDNSGIFASRKVSLVYNQVSMGGYYRQNTYLTENAINEIFLSSTSYTLTANGTPKYNLSFTATDFSNEWSLYILGQKSTCNAYSVKIYSFKISEKDPNTGDVTYVRDFVPCVKDNVCGLFDVVEQKFYESVALPFNIHNDLQGSGTENAPYQISCIQDFVLFNAFTVQTNYFVVTQDIKFNDGYFQRNSDGSCTYHDGGDGVLYDWKPSVTLFRKFDGQNHKLENFYSSYAGLILYGETANETNIAILNLDVCNVKMTGAYCVDENTLFPQKSSYVSMFLTCPRPNVNLTISNCEIDGCAYYTQSSTPSFILGVYAYGFPGYSKGSFTADKIITRGKAFTSTTLAIGCAYSELGGVLTNCTNYADINNIWSMAAGVYYNGLTGYMSSTLENCKNYGKIVGWGVAGGVAVLNRGVFRNCYNYGNVSTTSTSTGSSSTNLAGGVASPNNYEPANPTFEFYSCGNEGNITAGKTASGIYAFESGRGSMGNSKFENCYNRGAITSKDGSALGISYLGKGVKSCVNYGQVSGKNGSAGLFISVKLLSNYECFKDFANYGNVKSSNNSACGLFFSLNFTSGQKLLMYGCSNYGKISGNYACGLVGISGMCNLTLRNCENYGHITSSVYACGFMRVEGNSDTIINIENCANFGNVQSQNNRAMGFAVGSLSHVRLAIRNCLSAGDINGGLYYAPFYQTAGVSSLVATVKNSIADCKIQGQQTRQFWGNDFSAFFVHRMTGRIGMKEFESVGSFMIPIPSASYLENDLNFTRVV